MGYTDKKNVLQLVALLRAYGIRQVVLCPGSRDVPLVQAFSTCGDFECYSVTDERSAGFFAIGLALQGRHPVAVCCTSGSALLNLHPAVAEAFYRKVPLVVVSADRPAAWIGQMDGQTLPQPGAFGGLVKKSVDLPEVCCGEDEWYVNRLVNEALLELDHHGFGPVHINVPLSEPLFRFETEKLPDVRRIVAKLPPAGKRQTMLFSATLEPEVLALVDRWLVDPVSLEAEPEHVVTDLIDQHFYAVLNNQKLAMLLWLIRNEPFERMIIFGNWKEKNIDLVDHLYEYGVQAELLSGDIPQAKRLKILEKFKSGEVRIVVATDVAARGIHIAGISHVVNYDLPDHPEDYVHRIGRTGRAGARGKSISFVCEYGAYVMPEIEKYAQIVISTIQPEEEMLVLPERVNAPVKHSRSRNPSSGHRGGSRRPSSGRTSRSRR